MTAAAECGRGEWGGGGMHLENRRNGGGGVGGLGLDLVTGVLG